MNKFHCARADCMRRNRTRSDCIVCYYGLKKTLVRNGRTEKQKMKIGTRPLFSPSLIPKNNKMLISSVYCCLQLIKCERTFN